VTGPKRYRRLCRAGDRAHEHHFFIDTTDLQTGTTDGRYYRAWGVGGGAFVGYDHAVSDRVRLGLEAGLSFGGDNPRRFSRTGPPTRSSRATAIA
jgi:outer membrane immunogenic protein